MVQLDLVLIVLSNIYTSNTSTNLDKWRHDLLKKNYTKKKIGLLNINFLGAPLCKIFTQHWDIFNNIISHYPELARSIFSEKTHSYFLTIDCYFDQVPHHILVCLGEISRSCWETATEWRNLKTAASKCKWTDFWIWRKAFCCYHHVM